MLVVLREGRRRARGGCFLLDVNLPRPGPQLSLLHDAAPPTRCVEGWRPWQVPPLLAPQWCNNVSETDGNRRFTKLPHHPCSFAPVAPDATLMAALAAALAETRAPALYLDN